MSQAQHVRTAMSGRNAPPKPVDLSSIQVSFSSHPLFLLSEMYSKWGTWVANRVNLIFDNCLALETQCNFEAQTQHHVSSIRSQGQRGPVECQLGGQQEDKGRNPGKIWILIRA